MFRRLMCNLRHFGRDRRGNVAILVAFTLVILLITVGAAVDYGRALAVRDRMANAADSAALAMGSWTNLNQDQLTTKAKQYFAANYPPTTLGTAGTIAVGFSGDNITVTVSGSVPTTFMKLAHLSALPVAATSVVTKKQRNLEVVLVLDTTGSMGFTLGGSTVKIDALKSAAKQMVTTLFNGQSTSTTLKMGIVPFAAAVNVGTGKIASNPEWFDLNTYTSSNKTADPIAFEDLDKVSGVSTYNLYSNSGNSKALKNENWPGCVRERDGSYRLTDDAPSSGTPATRWVPYFAPDEPDSASGTDYANDYLCDNASSCSNGNSTTAPSASCVTGSSTSDQRQCNTPKYKGKTVSGSAGPDNNCPPAPITALTSTKSTIDSAIDALQPKGNTVIPSGLLWGWRVLSPTAPFIEGAAYSDQKWVKAVVLLTDGENSVNGGDSSTGINKSTYSAFGYARNGHMGNTSGSNAESTLDTYTTTVCNAIKTANPNNPILVYTIGLGVTSASQSLLQGCATKTSMFYNAPSSSQLASIFQDIAQGLGDLRIAQ
jgi:Flp pilus assembly protein TadG